MSKWLIALVFASGCAALVKSTQEPYDGDWGPPEVHFGGMAGNGQPWARVTNGLNQRLLVRVQCPERLLFDLPPRTSQRFFVTVLPRELEANPVCRVITYSPTNSK